MKITIDVHRERLFYCILYVFFSVAGQEVCAQQISDNDFVKVKGGCYQMGDQAGVGTYDERPVHEVCLSDFYISKYEVTQEQWQYVMGNNPSMNKASPRYPVEIVSWWDVETFINKLNAQTNRKYRLPTEAEWEFACRAGEKGAMYGTKDGSLSKELVLYSSDDKISGTIMEVGSFPPNQLGLYDMSGNVSEWVMDWYDRKYYANSPLKNPVVMETRMETLKVRRGGHWADKGSMLRCSFRNFRRPAFRLIGLGFRLAKDS